MHTTVASVTRPCLLLFLAAISLAAAPVVTFDPATGFTTHTNGSQTVGWAFNLSSSFTVNELGWYDQGGDGLGESHVIGIWDVLQNLLVSATVPAGTAGTLDGGFRMVSIPALVLPSGQYVIGGLTDANAGDLLYFSVTESVVSPVTWFGERFSNFNASLVFPATQGQGVTDGLYGPMFGFVAGTASPAPEPAGFGLVGGGLLAAGLWLKRRTAGRQ